MNYAIVLVAGLLIFSGCVSESEKTKITTLEETNTSLVNEIARLNSEKLLSAKEQEGLFQEYIAASYHYTYAKEQIGLASSNYQLWMSSCNESNNFQECYDISSSFNEIVTRLSSEAVDSFTLAEKKLKAVNGLSSDFLKKDIELRLTLIPLEKNYSANLSKTSNAWKNYIFEPSESADDGLYDIYADYAKQMLDDAVKVSKVGDEIDLLWEQNWYPTVPDSNSI